MLKYHLKKIAVTGGVSSGKSTVCKIFKSLGAYVVSADEVVHQLLTPTSAVGKKVINLIGHEIVVNEHIDRALIAKKVFNDPSLLNSLENLIHPAVSKEIEKQFQEFKQTPNTSLFIAEIPLLFETGNHDHYDIVISVIADPEISRQRFCKATGYKPDEYDKRMARQYTLNEKAADADYVIYNNGSLQDLEEKTRMLFEKLRK